ncbi:MAG: N-6 DNA methylase [Aerococcus sp.]|nr:N-6 DNA methylase [Aerococcus sp.]
MQKLTYEDFYRLAGVSQHKQFENFLMDIVFQPERREKFYRGLIELGIHSDEDIFQEYFELYSAERKSKQQDFTPSSVTDLLASLIHRMRVKSSGLYTYYDPTAGSGALLIGVWRKDRDEASMFQYSPRNYLYRADEVADNAIPYLIHNLTIKGMNAIVVHGNSLTGTAKQAYFIQNLKDDFMKFSSINVMPHTTDVMRYLEITRWEEKEKQYIEDKNVLPFIPAN